MAENEEKSKIPLKEIILNRDERGDESENENEETEDKTISIKREVKSSKIIGNEKVAKVPIFSIDTNNINKHLDREASSNSNTLKSTESTSEKIGKKKDLYQKNHEIKHTCDTCYGSSGSPISLNQNSQIIGINKVQSSKIKEDSLEKVKEGVVEEKPNNDNLLKGLDKNIKNKEDNKVGIVSSILILNLIGIFREIKNAEPDVETYFRLEKKSSKKPKNKEKPIYNIPIEKIKEEMRNKIKNKKNIENLKKGLNSNINKNINNIPFINPNNYNNFNNYNYSNINNQYIFNNFNGNMNVNMSNIIQYNYYKKYFDKIQKQMFDFQKLYNFGLSALQKQDNINNYLLYLNNYTNNIEQIGNNLLYSNNFGFFNNHLLPPNYYPNNNIMKLNNMSNMNNIINYNNKSNQNQEKYTITFKRKTNDPNIEQISKIHVTTSYVKENPNEKKENGSQKNEKKLINLEDIELNKETRTVVRLNPIPPNYSSFDISKLLDKYLKIESGKNQRIYKALYVPLCKIIGKNLGYCFVMMAKPKYVIEFYKTFEGKSFGKKKCKKPCNVIWADIQGEAFLKKSEEDPIRKPIIFKDLRDD
jgi:hypothetical protein